MLKCSDVYTEDLIFDFGVDTPICNLASILDTDTYEWVDSNLIDILVGGQESITIDYLLNRQDRYISPLLERLINHYGDDHLNSVNTKISNIIITKFLKGWSKLSSALFSDYNPIENYNMVENRSTDLTEETETEETVKSKYAGFNTSVMKDVSESSNNGSIEKTTTGGKTNNELTRSGNIGVTTSQQMIESEWNLRKKNLLDLIYRDIDSILFIDYYN